MSTPDVARQEYLTRRTETDFDMISFVRQLLIDSGASQEAIVAYNNNALILEGTDRVPHVQRFLLNRFWMMQLMSCPVVSVKERYCLIPNGDIADWCRLFQDTILPFALKNNLPHTLQ